MLYQTWDAPEARQDVPDTIIGAYPPGSLWIFRGIPRNEDKVFLFETAPEYLSGGNYGVMDVHSLDQSYIFVTSKSLKSLVKPRHLLFCGHGVLEGLQARNQMLGLHFDNNIEILQEIPFSYIRIRNVKQWKC